MCQNTSANSPTYTGLQRFFVTMNILLKKSCLLNIHEELEEKEVMNMDKSNLVGFLRKEIGRHSVLLLSCSSILFIYHDIHI